MAEDRLRKDGALDMRRLGAGVERIGVARAIVIPDRTARLHGNSGKPVVYKAQPYRDGSLRKGVIGRLLVSEHQPDADIAGGFVPHEGGTHSCRGIEARDRGEDLIVDVDELGGIARLAPSLCDHKRYAIADMPGTIARQHRSHRAMALGAAHVLGHEQRRERTKLCDIGAGQNAQHAWSGPRAGRVDVIDAGMGMRRLHDMAISLPRQIDVVDIAALAADESRVFNAANRLAYTVSVHRGRRVPGCSPLMVVMPLVKPWSSPPERRPSACLQAPTFAAARH